MEAFSIYWLWVTFGCKLSSSLKLQTLNVGPTWVHQINGMGRIEWSPHGLVDGPIWAQSDDYKHLIRCYTYKAVELWLWSLWKVVLIRLLLQVPSAYPWWGLPIPLPQWFVGPLIIIIWIIYGNDFLSNLLDWTTASSKWNVLGIRLQNQCQKAIKKKSM